MPSGRDWARAFAVQADADLKARESLAAHTELPPCQELHFLQMACEKLAKAHLYYSGNPPADIQSSHGHTAKQLPAILRETHRRLKRARLEHWLDEEVRHLAAEISRLHPQVDGGGTRPDNCEYPWTDAQGKVVAPAEHAFSNLALAKSYAGRELLKLLRLAAAEIIERG
jgi:hypothetical protein